MPSIVPCFEYDIFISYRHNDKRSGWVTEFVKALQEELAATIKEPVSVYFNIEFIHFFKTMISFNFAQCGQ